MKRNQYVPLLLLAITIFLAACSSSRSSTIARRNDIKGNWTLSQISYDGLAPAERIRLNLLTEGTADCLQGSTWDLPNNGYGSYTILANEQGCLPGQKNIVWSYRKENGEPIFQYKKLVGAVKAKDIEEGYRFRIISASENAMTLQSEITYEGNPIKINYDFTRN